MKAFTLLAVVLFRVLLVSSKPNISSEVSLQNGKKLLPGIPQIKLEVGTELVTLTNQQAFHRNCAGCHDEIVKTNKDLNPPTSRKCTSCHKRTAA